MSLHYNGHTFTTDAVCKCCIGDKRVVVIDPTGTRSLRNKFRMSMGHRWNQLRELTKQMLVKNDLLALKSGGLMNVNAPAITGAGSKIDIFQRWFDLALENAVLQKDGSFMRPFLESAYATGTTFGQAQAKTNMTNNLGGHRTGALTTLARVELQGIIEAVSQQAIRAVTNGLLTNAKPMTITRQVLNVIETVGRNRSNAMIELLTVRAHAEASLDIYEAAGLTTVGLLPESRAQAKVVTDAQTQQKATRKAEDARRSGPGSRSRRGVPSQSTIGRIRRAELNVARRLGESVNVRTAGDDDVCPVCEAIAENGPYGINTARGLIPAHPHCRCVFVPAGDARFAQEDIRSVIGSYRANEYDLGLATSGLSLSDVAAIFANSLTDEWNEEDHPRAENGQFGSGGGSVSAEEAQAEAKVPREGSRKHEVFKTYMQHGRQAAIEHAKRLGLGPTTAQSWSATWKREGSHGGSGGSVAPPTEAPKPVPTPTPPTPPVHVPTPEPLGRSHRLYVKQNGVDQGHLKDIQSGIDDIPAEHQSALAKRGLTISGQKRVTLNNAHDEVLGVFRSSEYGNHTRVEVAEGYSTRGGFSAKAKDVRGTTVHELGHAVDHAHGWRLGKDVSAHVDADAKAGMSKNDRDFAAYYFSNDKERYAELYRAAYSKGGTAFGMRTERARKIFAKSIAHLKQQKLTFKGY